MTLTPTLALKDGAPYLAFAVQGGDSQDQNLLQFFLNVVEFGMTVQQAVEAPNINSFQMRSSFGAHEARPGTWRWRRPCPRPLERRCGGWDTCCSSSERIVGADQRDSVRSEAWDDVGRIEPSRRGLRDRMVKPKTAQKL